MTDFRDRAIEALNESYANGPTGVPSVGHLIVGYLDAHPEAKAALYLWLIATRPEPDTGVPATQPATVWVTHIEHAADAGRG